MAGVGARSGLRRVVRLLVRATPFPLLTWIFGTLLMPAAGFVLRRTGIIFPESIDLQRHWDELPAELQVAVERRGGVHKVQRELKRYDKYWNAVGLALLSKGTRVGPPDLVVEGFEEVEHSARSGTPTIVVSAHAGARVFVHLNSRRLRVAACTHIPPQAAEVMRQLVRLLSPYEEIEDLFRPIYVPDVLAAYKASKALEEGCIFAWYADKVGYYTAKTRLVECAWTGRTISASSIVHNLACRHDARVFVAFARLHEGRAPGMTIRYEPFDAPRDDAAAYTRALYAAVERGVLENIDQAELWCFYPDDVRTSPMLIAAGGKGR